MKAGGPLGLSIVGGIDHSSHPFGADEPGIFVSRVGTLLQIPVCDWIHMSVSTLTYIDRWGNLQKS